MSTFSNEEQAVYVFESEMPGKVKGRIPMMQLLLPEAETFVKIQWRQIRMPGCNLGYGDLSRTFRVYPFSHINRGYQRWRSFHKAFNRHCNSIGFAIISVDAAYLEIRRVSLFKVKKQSHSRNGKEHGNMLLHVQFLEPSKNDIQTLNEVYI